MTQLKIENHNAVALLNRLRKATHSSTARERKSIFNGLREALKGLGMIEAKGPVEGIYEGIDRNGSHWFMVDSGEGDFPRVEMLESIIADAAARIAELEAQLYSAPPLSGGSPPTSQGFIEDPCSGLKEELRLLIGGEGWRPSTATELLSQVVREIKRLRADNNGLSHQATPDTTGG